MAAVSKQGLKVGILVRTAAKKPLAPRELPEWFKETALRHQWDRWERQERELGPDDLAAYLHLRERLAVFEQMAIYHFMSGKTPQQRTKRAERIKKHLKTFLAQAGLMVPEGPCPVGYCECDAWCMPCYMCPLE
ncbi:MAG: hypothetical protein ABIN58_07385 [candidate division WOR-3 bacterium]